MAEILNEQVCVKRDNEPGVELPRFPPDHVELPRSDPARSMMLVPVAWRAAFGECAGLAVHGYGGRDFVAAIRLGKGGELGFLCPQ